MKLTLKELEGLIKRYFDNERGEPSGYEARLLSDWLWCIKEFVTEDLEEKWKRDCSHLIPAAKKHLKLVICKGRKLAACLKDGRCHHATPHFHDDRCEKACWSIGDGDRTKSSCVSAKKKG